MRERVFIRKCPDGCGKDEYDLGLYRGFNLYQKPFYGGWYVYAAMVHPKDELDELLLKEFEGLSGKICLDTETSDHLTIEQCEQYVIETIDKFWDKKQSYNPKITSPKDLVLDVAIGLILESRLALDFIQSKGLLEEWNNYCKEHYDEIIHYLNGLIETIKTTHIAQKCKDEQKKE